MLEINDFTNRYAGSLHEYNQMIKHLNNADEKVQEIKNTLPQLEEVVVDEHELFEELDKQIENQQFNDYFEPTNLWDDGDYYQSNE